MQSPGKSASGANNRQEWSPSQQGDGDPPRYRRVVVKAGTSVLTGGSNGDQLDLGVMADLAGQISELRQSMSMEILLVSSGAIAAGREALGKDGTSPQGRNILNRQMLAALGQGRLMHQYQQLFAEHQVQVAQTLLTINDLSDRQSYLNVRNTLLGLLELGVVPILNENDVVAVDEIGEVFGDNDRLSALVATLVDADLLLLLTDTGGLYTADPNREPNAELIPRVERIDASIMGLAEKHRSTSTRGGMASKLLAAQRATGVGATTVIAPGHEPDVVTRVACGEEIGTLFPTRVSAVESRKRWLRSGSAESGGVLEVDAGAARAVRSEERSLLPAGVRGVRGSFNRGDVIAVESNGELIAYGQANYGADELRKLCGARSSRIVELLGYAYGDEAIHRNNMAVL